MVIDFYDTSALLKNPSAIHEGDYISHYVISEIEEIKTSSHKDEKVKANARQVSRWLLANPVFICYNFSEKEILRMMRKYPYLPDNTDGRIIAEALLVAKKNNTNIAFHTADINMMLFVIDLPNFYLYIEKDKEEATKEPWAGWGKYFPDDKQMAMLYTDPRVNILGAKINEYCEIFSGEELKDILRWDGESYQKLKYREMRNPYTQEVIRPRNLEQKMAFDLLQNQKIKVKTLFSSWGSGKTMLALTYALEQVNKGNYQKIIFIRNNIIAKDTKDIGYLPSDLRSKMSIWNRNLADHVGGDLSMDELEEEGVIETFPLSHCRGRSFRSCICIVDECENLTDKHITLLMSRIEENSEIIFCGDASQCDFTHGQLMGMNKMIESLAGEPLFGAVKLIKSERGPVPRLCDKIIPPQ